MWIVLNIIFDRDGYDNDTIYSNPITLEKQYYDTDLIIDFFTNELENKIKAVGVDHSINNNDHPGTLRSGTPLHMHTFWV